MSVVSNQVLQRVKLAAANVEIATDGRDPEMIDARLAEVGQDVGSRFAVGFAY